MLAFTDSKTKTPMIVEIAGWYGIMAIIGAYALVSFHVIEVDHVIYQLLNATGALGVVWMSWIKRTMQTAVLNMFWAAIAVVALARLLL